MFCPLSMMKVDICFWTVFQRTDWQHFLLAIMEKQSNDNKMKNSWLKGEATPSDSGKKGRFLYFFFSSTFLHREAGVYLFSPLSRLFYSNYSISLGTIFSFSIILIRRLKNSTWLNNDGMAKTNMIQAACAFSSDMMSSVMPSFPRFSIRGLYLCLFLSCLVIPNNSRKPNVTSFLYVSLSLDYGLLHIFVTSGQQYYFLLDILSYSFLIFVFFIQ